MHGYILPGIMDGDSADWATTTDLSDTPGITDLPSSSRLEYDVTTLTNWAYLLAVPLIVFTASGNLMVCAVVIRVPKLQTVNNIFLTSLAIADLMVAILVMPLGLVKDIYGFWPSSAYLCVVWNTFDVLCCTASILHISVISLDRYLAICDPIRFQQKRKRFSRTRMKILVVWLTSFALSCPLLILGLTEQEGVVNYRLCTIESRQFKLYGSAVAFVLPLFIIVATYPLTALTLHHKGYTTKRTQQRPEDKATRIHRSKSASPRPVKTGHPNRALKKHHSSPSGGPVDNHRKPTTAYRVIPMTKKSKIRVDKTFPRSGFENEQKANLVLFLVFIIFVSAWTPFFAVNIAFSFCDDSCVEADTLFTVLTWLGWASSSLNPIIYTIFNTDFRRAFYHILTCRWKRLDSQPTAMHIHLNEMMRKYEYHSSSDSNICPSVGTLTP